jgi:hypothetical protein
MTAVQTHRQPLTLFRHPISCNIMRPDRRFIVLVLGAVFTAIVATTFAQSSASLKTLMEQRDAALRQLRANASTQRTDLFGKYATALDALLKQFTAKGDLDTALIIKSEIESARTRQAVGPGVLPALDSYRATLQKSVAGIDGATAASQTQIDAGYVRSLNQLKVDLTKAGLLEDAVSVDTEIKQVSSAASTAPSSPAAAAPPLTVERLSTTPPPAGATGVNFEKPIVGEITLPVGNYRPRETVIIGGPGESKGTETPGKLHILPGSQFDSASLFARKGLLTADHSLFKDSNISSDFGASFQAKDCLFSECKIGKGGHWSTEYFSTRMTFENCAFSHSFLTSWNTKLVGVKITRCSFHNVTFAPVSYVSDAGKEVAMAGMMITQCKFVGCEIPESFFMATKDCLFEDCRFKAAKSKERPPISTPMKLRAYLSDPSSAPTAPPMCSYEILDAKSAPKEMGASLAYQSAVRTLRFQ